MFRFALAILVSLVSFQRANAAITLLEKDGWKFMTSGFVEMDMITDSAKSLTEVAGNNPIDRSGTSAGDSGRTQFGVRNSRLAFTALPPLAGNWKTKGYLEFDLLGYNPAPGNGNTESGFFANPALRLRHAYFSAEESGFQMLAGQTWTLFGWQPNYVLSTTDVAPVAGNLYERTPQVTAIKDFAFSDNDHLQAGLSIIRPPQREANLPGMDGGLRLSFGGRRAPYTASSGEVKTEPMSIAVSGTVRDFTTPGTTTASPLLHYMGGAFAVDTLIPLISSSDEKDTSNTLSLIGEFTSGKGDAEEFSGWNGNLPQLLTSNGATLPNLDAGQGGIGVASGTFDLVRLQSFNVALQYHFPEGWNSFVNAGYSQLYSNNAAGFTPGANKIAYNRSEATYGNFFHDFSREIRLGLEYAYFQTRYADGVLTHNHRIQASGWFRF